MADPVLVHGCPRRVVAKEAEFRADSWSAPEWILQRHASNQLVKLGVDSWASDPAAGIKTGVPVVLISSSRTFRPFGIKLDSWLR